MYLLNNEEIIYSRFIGQPLSLRVVHMHLPTAYTFSRYIVELKGVEGEQFKLCAFDDI